MPNSGKVAPAAALPQLERSALRLDGIEIYSVIGALQAGTSVAMMQEVGLEALSDSSGNVTLTVAGSAAASGDLVGEIICALFLLCGTAAALGGIYATVVFALCSL